MIASQVNWWQAIGNINVTLGLIRWDDSSSPAFRSHGSLSRAEYGVCSMMQQRRRRRCFQQVLCDQFDAHENDLKWPPRRLATRCQLWRWGGRGQGEINEAVQRFSVFNHWAKLLHYFFFFFQVVWLNAEKYFRFIGAYYSHIFWENKKGKRESHLYKTSGRLSQKNSGTVHDGPVRSSKLGDKKWQQKNQTEIDGVDICVVFVLWS